MSSLIISLFADTYSYCLAFVSSWSQISTFGPKDQISSSLSNSAVLNTLTPWWSLYTTPMQSEYTTTSLKFLFWNPFSILETTPLLLKWMRQMRLILKRQWHFRSQLGKACLRAWCPFPAQKMIQRQQTFPHLCQGVHHHKTHPLRHHWWATMAYAPAFGQGGPSNAHGRRPSDPGRGPGRSYMPFSHSQYRESQRYEGKGIHPTLTIMWPRRRPTSRPYSRRQLALQCPLMPIVTIISEKMGSSPPVSLYRALLKQCRNAPTAIGEA